MYIVQYRWGTLVYFVNLLCTDGIIVLRVLEEKNFAFKNFL